MTPGNRDDFFAHSMKEIPREACALLINENGHERLVICKNKSVRQDQFEMDGKDYADAADRGDILGVLHSHVYTSNRPSEADKVACEATGLPWYICSVPTGSWFRFEPSGYKAPLIGRQFTHGVLDCYSLIKDYYSEVLKIEIPDFERDYEWWEQGQNLYIENFEKAGFREVSLNDLKENDVMLMQIQSKIINHGAVYLGNDVMLHHLNGRLSTRQTYGGYYRKHTAKVVRHENY